MNFDILRGDARYGVRYSMINGRVDVTVMVKADEWAIDSEPSGQWSGVALDGLSGLPVDVQIEIVKRIVRGCP